MTTPDTKEFVATRHNEGARPTFREERNRETHGYKSVGFGCLRTQLFSAAQLCDGSFAERPQGPGAVACKSCTCQEESAEFVARRRRSFIFPRQP